jgi:hypothetical protein
MQQFLRSPAALTGREQTNDQEIEMRKVFVIALGLAGLGAFVTVQSAFAQPDCEGVFNACMSKGTGTHSSAYHDYCTGKAQECYKRQPINQVKNGPFQPGRSGSGSGNGSGKGSGGGSKPKPGAHRTADGGTIMVTPQGREWVWNGQTTTVSVVSKPGYKETITVMQGDPTVTMRATVNGVSYNVADPKYPAAIAAEQKRAAAAAAQALKGAAKLVSTPQKQNTIGNAQSPGGAPGPGKPKHQAN